MPFYVGQDEAVSLALYDLQGRLAKIVVAHQILQKGVHNIAVESNGLTNSVYICALSISDRLISQKVVIMK